MLKYDCYYFTDNMNSLTKRLTITLIVIILLPFSTIAYGQQRPTLSTHVARTNLYIPLASLSYGNNNTQSFAVNQYAETFNDTKNHTFVVYDAGAGYIPIPYRYEGKTINSTQLKNTIVTLDSYYHFNRRLPQIIPKYSNVVLNFTRILNPSEASDITQAKLATASTVQIKYSIDGSGRIIYSKLPMSVDPGDYVALATVYFPDYKASVTYISRIIVNNTVPVPGTTTTSNSSSFRSPGGNQSTY